MMNYSPIVSNNYEESKKQEYKQFLKELGSDIDFENNTWVCDKKIRRANELRCDVSLYFSKIPEKFRDMVKYFVIIKILDGSGISSVAGNLISLTTFLNFFVKKYPNDSLDICDITTASQYKSFMDNLALAESTKFSKWSSINAFFNTMHDGKFINRKNPFCENPYAHYQRNNYKYIPNNLIARTDKAFDDESIPLYLRCIYWILRLIPSRINEVLGMKSDCLKPYSDHYCLFIPTWKQNGGYLEPEMRVIHIEDTGISSKLIQLIKQQQLIANSLQQFMEVSKMGALFTYQKYNWRKNGVRRLLNEYKTAYDMHVARNFKRICESNEIKDEQGNTLNITSHQFRHNGITDRLAAGFTPEQIRFMTAHHGDAMIYKAYNHLDLKPEIISEKQSYVLKEPNCVSKPCVLFGGRILNMEEQLEKRLLKSIRANRVMGGICSDITGCKSDMFNCLDCNSFIPDVEQLSYFKEQILSWHNKAEKFSNFPIIKNNALKNAALFQSVVEKILQVNEGDCNE